MNIKNFQHFEDILIKTFEENKNEFNFKTTLKKSNSKTTDINQTISDDYGFDEKQLFELSENEFKDFLKELIKKEISVSFNDFMSDKDFTYSYENTYHNKMYKMGKNTLEQNALTKIKIKNNCLYLLPYLFTHKDITKSGSDSILKVEYRFIVIVLNK